MEDEDYPPPREEEEPGPSYTSSELHSAANTETSSDLASDLIESAERRYHKTVTGLQIAHHKAVQKLMETLLAQTREYVRQHKKCDKNAIVEVANQYLEKQRGEMERALDVAIEQEREGLQQLITRVRQWCEALMSREG